MSNNLEAPYIVRLEYALWSWNQKEAMALLAKMSEHAAESISQHALLREASLISNRIYTERKDEG